MNTNTALLPVYPPPNSGESLRGYMLRIGTVNGCPNETVFRKFFGFGNTDTIGPYLIDSAASRSLALALRTDFSNLQDSFGNTTLLKAVRKNRLMLRIQPRICPDCLKEKASLKEIWDFTPLSHCLKHNATLQDECPHCETNLSWNRSHFLRCGECDELLSSWPTLRIAHDFLASFYKFHASQDISSSPFWFRDLHLAAEEVGRAADFLSPRIPFRSMPNRLLAELYEQSCRFLLASDRIEQLDAYRAGRYAGLGVVARQSFQARKLPHTTYCNSYSLDGARATIQFSKLDSLRLSYARRNTCFTPAKVAKSLWVDSHRVRNLDLVDLDEIELTLRMQAPWSHISKIIGFGCEFDRSAIKLFTINARAKHFWDSCFDLRLVRELLEKFPVLNITADFKPSESDSQLFDWRLQSKLKHLGITQVDLALFAISTNAPICYRTSNVSGFEGIFVRTDAFLEKIEDFFINFETNIPARQISTALCADDSFINGLVRHGYLSATSKTVDAVARIEITGKSWWSFCKKYLVISQWCKENKISTVLATNKLKREGINPSFIIDSHYTSRCFRVYERQPKVDEILSTLLHSRKP